MFQNLAQRLVVSRANPMETNNDDVYNANLNNVNTPPPPPYPADSDSDYDEDGDESTNGSDSEHGRARSSRRHRRRQPPIKLMINAAHHIQGSGNVLPVSPNPLVDATRLSMTLANALGMIGTGPQVGNAAAATAGTANSDSATRQIRTRGLDITINCGITIVGDRNMIGAIGLRKPAVPGGPVTPGLPVTERGPNPAAPAPPGNNGELASQANAAPQTLQSSGGSGLPAGGLKRKVEDTESLTCESPAKKIAGGSEQNK